MKKLSLILAILLFPIKAHATFGVAGQIWEVDPVTGSDLNGCAWDAGSTGVDYSTAVRVNVDGTIVTAVDAGAGATLTVSGYTVATGDVGNTLNITGGTLAVLGRARITAVNTGTHVWTMDHNITTGVGTVTGILGGGCQTLQSAATGYINNNKVFVKAEGTIVIGSSITLSVVGSGFPRNSWQGYTTTRGDNGQPTIQMSASMTQPAVAINYTGRLIDMRNFIIDCNNVATSTGVLVADAHEDQFNNLKIINCTGNAFASSAAGSTWMLMNSEITGTTSAASGAVNLLTGTGELVYRCNIHDNATHGIIGAGGFDTIIDNLITRNTGDGIQLLDRSYVFGNTIHSNTGNGITVGVGGPDGFVSQNNIITNNGSCGTNCTVANNPATPYYDGNAYYENGGGNRCFMDAVTSQNGIASYANLFDVQLSTASSGGISPYQNVSLSNYMLNGSLGGGGGLIHKGVPQSYAGNSGIAYPDFGAFQSPAMPHASAQ